MVLIFITCIFASTGLFANSNIDSLEKELHTSTGIEQVEILIALCNSYSTTNPIKALRYGEKAYQLAFVENNMKLMAESLNVIGFSHFYSHNFLVAAHYLNQSMRIYSKLGNENKEAKASQNIGLAYLQANIYDSSGIYLRQALALYEKLNKPKDIAYSHTNLGLLSYMKSDYATALDHYNRASEICKEIDDPENYANLLNRIAMTYWSLGIYDKALAYALESVSEREKIGMPEKLATAYNNIGAIYKDLGEHGKALDYFRRALVVEKQVGDSMGMPLALTNIGSVYNSNNQTDSAMRYYKKALQLSDDIGDKFQSAKTRHNMGLIYQETGQLDTAIIYISEYLNYCRKIGSSDGAAIANLNLGKIFLKMKNYKKAESHLNKSVLLTDSLNLLNTLQSSYATLSKLREAEGNVRSALAYYKLSSQLNDSIFNIEKARAISEMETKYETEKKEQENTLLKKDIEIEKRKSSYLMVLAIVLMLAGIVSVALFYFIRKTAINKRKLAESEADRLEEKVAHQKRELASSTLTLSRNLEFINSLIEDIQTLSKDVDNDNAYASIRRIVKKLETQNSDKCWQEFETRFQEIHHGFYRKLHSDFSGLTPNDLKICALLKMGMNTKEICSVSFQSVRAVEAARLRLRKKLKLAGGENLAMFLQKI